MADRHLQMLTLARNPDDASDESFGFYVQQAAEKCLKAWIALLGGEYPLTHELGALIDRIRRRDEAVSEFADLARFSPFAVQFRYEPVPEGAARIDRPAAIRQAEALRRRLPSMLREARWTQPACDPTGLLSPSGYRPPMTVAATETTGEHRRGRAPRPAWSSARLG